jgi:hypothetical protein
MSLRRNVRRCQISGFRRDRQPRLPVASSQGLAPTTATVPVGPVAPFYRMRAFMPACTAEGVRVYMVQPAANPAPDGVATISSRTMPIGSRFPVPA